MKKFMMINENVFKLQEEMRPEKKQQLLKLLQQMSMLFEKMKTITLPDMPGWRADVLYDISTALGNMQTFLETGTIGEENSRGSGFPVDTL
jgi:hypothetical protein